MYRRLEFYFETSPLQTRLYFSVWCTNLSRVRQEMSIRYLLNLNDIIQIYGRRYLHRPSIEKGTSRKMRNQKKIPTPKTEMDKHQTNNQVLIP